MWKKVSDILPDVGTKVLAYGDGDVTVGTYGHGRNRDEWWDELNVDMDGSPTDLWEVTHWMPLPAPPTAEQGESAPTDTQHPNG